MSSTFNSIQPPIRRQVGIFGSKACNSYFERHSTSVRGNYSTVLLPTLDISDFDCIFMTWQIIRMLLVRCLFSAIHCSGCSAASCNSALVTSATSRSADRFNVTPAGSLLLNPSCNDAAGSLSVCVLLGDTADLLSAL